MSDTPPEIIELRNEAGDFGAANMVYIGDAEEAVHKAIARVKADAQRTFDLFTADTEACRTREIVESLRERVLMRAAADFIERTFLNGEGTT